MMSDEPKLKLMFSDDDVLPEGVVRMFRPLYGGDVESFDGTVRSPFVLRKEAVEIDAGGRIVKIAEPAAERVQPRCAHFGVCGGCQYQMIEAHEQLTVKRLILRNLLHEAGVEQPDDIQALNGPEYLYRNRIRLRIANLEGQFRFGYNRRASTEFLPITMCPIATPLLWSTAEALLQLAAVNADAVQVFTAANELELFANDDLTRLQLTFACAPRMKLDTKSFERAMQAAQGTVPQITGAGAIVVDPRTGPTGKVLATWGSGGIAYHVAEESYWVTRGGFFQVNRFLVDKLVALVCEGRRGELAWDLYAGVGLFSRVLARSFGQVTAVEANPGAVADLRPALSKLGTGYKALEATTLDFLRQAAVQRERPDLIVLDPPRAGVGVEACELLLRLRAQEMVYVSCDPTTLARDLAVLQRGYRIAALHLVDLFPQTFHMETVVVLQRK